MQHIFQFVLLKKLHKLCVWFGSAAGNFLNVFGAAPAEKRKRRERNSRARSRAERKGKEWETGKTGTEHQRALTVHTCKKFSRAAREKSGYELPRAKTLKKGARVLRKIT